MSEAEAQAVLLVRAFEEADVAGQLLTVPERTRCTEAARAAADGDEQRLVATRAAELLDLVATKVPHVRGVLALSRGGAGLGRLVLVVAFVLGLTTNAIGPSQSLHVLAGPLLGLLAWNVGIYVALVVWRWRAAARSSAAPKDENYGRRSDRGDGKEHGTSGVALAAAGGLLSRVARWLVDRTLSRTQARRVQDQEVVVEALGRYASTWAQDSVALVTARLARLLHLSAIALVAGVVLGMYVRGLGLEYRVRWESTFLDAPQVQGLLTVVLGPAAKVLGVTIPDVAPLAEEPGEAALWIHLYAVAALLYVGLPRALLVGVTSWRIRRLSSGQTLDLRAPYFQRLLAPDRGRAVTVDVLPYSHTVRARVADALRVLLHDVFGVRADVRFADGLEYGAEADEITSPDDPGRTAGQGWCAVLLYSLAQSPETEVHGRLVEDIRPMLGEGEQLLVVVDGSTYRERVGDAVHRLDERRRAWDRVVREAGAEPVHVDLDRPVPDDILLRIGEALWPPGAGA